MPEPKHHAEERGWIETILQFIPGFRGYLRKENRREADELQREWLADRLQRGKRGLDSYAVALTDAGRLDELPKIERLRTKLDTIISRIRGAMQGYSGFFDLVDVNEEIIDRVYKVDVSLMQTVGKLADEIEDLKNRVEEPGDLVSPLLEYIETIADEWDRREDILKGLE